MLVAEGSGTIIEFPRSSREPGAKQRDRLVGQALQLLELRNRRAQLFGKAMFGEPAWEMLLLLYAGEGGERQTAIRLAQRSGASRATALRWIDYLVHQNLVTREPHPTDRRATFVQLSEKGRQALDEFLTETLQLNG